jgi:predicted metal-binding integral membrane protein DUF2182
MSGCDGTRQRSSSFALLWLPFLNRLQSGRANHFMRASSTAGLYELTPLKRNCRRRCRERVRSGFEFGLYCVGSSAGLMVMLVALGVMSVTLMAVVAAPTSRCARSAAH